MSLSGHEGDTKGLGLAGHGATEAEGAAEDVLLFHNSNIISIHPSKNTKFFLNS